MDRRADAALVGLVMEAWRFKDPALVYERIQEQEQRARKSRQQRAKEKLEALFGGEMTQDQSRLLEDYLMIWHDYERAYRPHLGAPRVSVYSRGMQASEVYSDRDESENRWEKSVAETLSACMDELPWQQRSSVTMHCTAKATGASVIRNPRMTIEEHQTQYQAGKLAIFGMPRMRELMR